MRVLTPDQELLARYLTEQGVSRIDRLLIVAELYEPEATLEMLTYIAETMEKGKWLFTFTEAYFIIE